jgi:transmembrane sensor
MRRGKMNKYNDILKNWQTPEGLSEDEAFQKIEGRLTSDYAPNTGRVRSLWLAAASVAAVALFAWMILLPNNRVIREATEIAFTKVVTLPDGSTVTLNAQTVLTYNESWTDERRVEMSGEAFFEVKKGSTFEVVTPQGTVTVLGTSFNVYNREKDWQVACKTGKVKVVHNGEQAIISPGQCVELIEGRLEIAEFDVDQRTWKEGVFYYENDQLSEIIAEMERQFNIQIECSKEVLAIKGVTTNFDKNDLQAALQKVATPMGLIFVKETEGKYRLQKTVEGL